MTDDDPKVLKFSAKNIENSNFKEFAKHVMDGNEIKSIRVLRDIFNLSYDSAEKATKHFLAKYEENPGVFMHVMEIRFKVQNGKNHEALKALYELFGLQSIDGILALEAMREIIKNAEESDNP